MVKVLLSVGGTGGHIYPALTVAQNLQKVGISVIVAGVDLLKWKETFKGIEIVSFDKPTSVSQWLTACKKGFRLCKKEKPSIVVGFGSYHSVPCVMGALISNTRYSLYEPNAVLGKSNLLFFWRSRWVATYFLMKKSTKVKKLSIPTISQEYKAEKDIDLLIVGGSLGSSFFNREIPLLLKGFTGKIVHITGRKKGVVEVKNTYESFGVQSECEEYSHDIHTLLSRSKCAIVRCGASMLVEVISYKVPSLVVPLSNAARNHQFCNAQAATKRGCIKVLSENDIKNMETVEFHKEIEMVISRSNKSKECSVEQTQSVTLSSLIIDEISS